MRLKRFLAIQLLAGVVGLLVTPALRGAETGHPEGPHYPPAVGKFVRGHWTPYEPPDPAKFPEGTRIHIIVKGDTLWDLSTTYQGDPWLWPQIWDQNRYILDSHWIYPGDPLVIPPPATVVPTPPTSPVVDASPPPTEPSVPTPVAAAEVDPILEPGEPVYPTQAQGSSSLMGPQLRPMGDATDLYCSSYVTPHPKVPALQVAKGKQYGKEMHTDFETVYLNQGLAEDVLPGTEYMVVRHGSTVKHPATGKVVGSLVHQVGRLRVIASQNHTATAWIHSSCSEILIGDQVVPFEEVAVPLAAGPPVTPGEADITGEDGFIIYGDDGARELGMGNVVEIDVGSGAGIAPGDFLVIFRYLRKERGFYSTETFIEGATGDELRHSSKSPYPPQVLGQLVVFRVGESTATGKIVYSDAEITVGDKVAKL